MLIFCLFVSFYFGCRCDFLSFALFTLGVGPGVGPGTGPGARDLVCDCGRGCDCVPLPPAAAAAPPAAAPFALLPLPPILVVVAAADVLAADDVLVAPLCLVDLLLLPIACLICDIVVSGVNRRESKTLVVGRDNTGIVTLWGDLNTRIPSGKRLYKM